MSGRYLSLKFAFVAILVVLCLASLFYGNGLKMGQDIAGGYSMIFEVQNPENNPSLIQQVISVVKPRVDPGGLSGLEWRPLGATKFEVRMPAPSPESGELRNEYLNALDALVETNIDRSDLRTLQALPAEERNQRIEELCGGNVTRAQHVREVLAAAGKLDAVETSLQALRQQNAAMEDPSEEQIRQMQEKLLEVEKQRSDAAGEYRDALAALREDNINPRELTGILNLYEDALKQEGKTRREEILRDFQQRSEEYRNRYEDRAEQIAAVTDAFRNWLKVRRPLEDPNDLKRLIRKAGVLEFRIVPMKPGQEGSPLSETQVNAYRQRLEQDGPGALLEDGEPYAWFPLRDDQEGMNSFVIADFGGQRYMLLSNRPNERLVREQGDEAPSWTLASARVMPDQQNQPAVSFTLDAAGARMFGQLTGSNIGRNMAILLDDEVYSFPVIRSTITGNGQITGQFTMEEVNDLVRVLRSGSLPARLNPEPVSETVFGAAIGEVNKQMGFRAAIIGLIAVAAFMLLYYLLAGALADVALMLNLILVLGAMSLIDVALTLPGIAGVILTIGIAVDANVLIFERLREEQDRGQNVQQAIKNAYERAFSAIFDANITTLLICLFLYVVFQFIGMEEVRGFAITLGLGVLFSMFTALVVTRWIFQLFLQGKLLKNPVKMMRIFPTFRVNWLQKRYAFWVLSILLLVLGVSSILWQGRNLLGIEFSAGTQAVIKLKDDALIDGKLPTDGLVREKFSQEARTLGNDKLINARVETVIQEDRVEEFLSLYDGAGADGTKDGQITLAEWSAARKNKEFFEALDANGDGVLEAAELESLPQTSYQISTTETSQKQVNQTVEGALGPQLQRRLACKFDWASGQTIPEMGVELGSGGRTRITGALAQGSTAAYRDELLDFEGGLLLVVEDVSPALTDTELRERIRDIRLQPDFSASAVNPYKVLGITPAGEGTFSSFAVLVRPVDPEMVASAEGMAQFASAETELLSEALKREEAMVVINFDPAIAGLTGQLAVVAVVLSWLAIVIYLWLRFGSIRWGLAAVVCLVHDVVIVVGLVAVSGWLYHTSVGRALGMMSFKLDLPMVAALLTVIGYSVNDTIVVFDRIRENRGKLRTVTGEVINDSINQTLPRTLLTSFTTFLVLLIMYIWGGVGIRSFSYALLAGIIFGTYSSVAVASPLLLGVRQALTTKVARSTEELEPAAETSGS